MNTTKIKIEYGQIKFEVESDAENAAKERDKFLETLPILFSLHSPMQNLTPQVIDNENEKLENSEKKFIEYKSDKNYNNINTFIKDKGFKTNNDKCLGFAYFMQEIEKVDFIDSNSIKERMKKAKAAIPNNVSMAINQITQKGYLQPIENENSSLTSYYMTEEGKEYINSFQKPEKKAKKSTKKQTSNITESKYSTLNKTKLNLENYPSIIELGSTKDKIMLMMYMVKDNDLGEFFTVNDILYIMNKVFNEKITVDMVKGQFKNNATKMFYDKQLIEGSKKIHEYKLLAVGEKYVKENILNK